MPFGSRIKDIFHHTIHLNISFSKIDLSRLCFCSVVMKTDKSTYGKLILFAFYQTTEITTCSNSNGFVFPGQPYTCICAQCCAQLHRNQAESPVSSPLIALLVRYGKPVLLLQKNLFNDKITSVLFPVFWAYQTCITEQNKELLARLFFYVSISDKL